MALPDIRTCLLCEDVRLEQRGLVSIMGLYGSTPQATIKLLNFQTPASWVFVFLGARIDSQFRIDLKIRNAQGVNVVAKVIPPFILTAPISGYSSLLWFRVEGNFPGPGNYEVALESGGAEFFSDTFGLQQGYQSDFK